MLEATELPKTRKTTPAEPYLTRPAAAEYLSQRLGRRITISALKNWALAGTGPHYTVILRRASYKRSDLDAWIDEQAQG